MLPPGLQALKEAAQARRTAAAKKARQEAEVCAAMNRDALRDCIETTVPGDVLTILGDIDLSKIGPETGSFTLVVELPWHCPLLASFSRHAVELKWQRQEYSRPGAIWRVRRGGKEQDFIDLGEALMVAEINPPVDVAGQQEEALDEVPF